jgi:hypothetical protein
MMLADDPEALSRSSSFKLNIPEKAVQVIDTEVCYHHSTRRILIESPTVDICFGEADSSLLTGSINVQNP